jgi:hypothetical protein
MAASRRIRMVSWYGAAQFRPWRRHRPCGVLIVAAGTAPLDQGWPLRLAALVAHHCHAEVVAAAWGLAEELSQFPRQDSVIADALVYVEMASGWDGGRVSLQQRLDDLQQSSGRNDDAIARARTARRVRLLTAVERTEHRLQALGHSHGIAWNLA